MNLMFCIPCIGDVPFESAMGFVQLAIETARLEEIDNLQIASCINIFPFDRARNRLVATVREAKADLLFFLDQDMIVPINAVASLWKVMKERKCPIVSGHYYRRTYPYTTTWKRIVEEKKLEDFNPREGVHTIHTGGSVVCDDNWELLREQVDCVKV